MLLGALGPWPSLSWHKAWGMRFWIDIFTEKTPESQKDCPKVIGSGAFVKYVFLFIIVGALG